MKKYKLTILFLLISIISFSQAIEKDILGTWEMTYDGPDYTWTFNKDGTLIENNFGTISNYTYKFVGFKECNSRFTETEYETIVSIIDKDGDAICYGVSLSKLENRHDLSFEEITSGMGMLLLEKYFD